MVSTRRSRQAPSEEGDPAAATAEAPAAAAAATGGARPRRGQAAAGAAAAAPADGAPAGRSTRGRKKQEAAAADAEPVAADDEDSDDAAAEDGSSEGEGDESTGEGESDDEAGEGEDDDGEDDEGEEEDVGGAAAAAANGRATPGSAKRKAPGGAAGGAGGAGGAHGRGVLEAEAEALDAFGRLPELRDALELLQRRVDDSAVFLRPAPEVAEAARLVAKLLYKHSVGALLAGGSRQERRALRSGPAAPLPDLHTDASFDPEQIWLQMEMATDAAVRRIRRLVRASEPLAAAGSAARLVTPQAEAGIDMLLSGGGSGSEEGDEDGSMEGDEDEEDEDGLGGSSGGEGEDEEDEEEGAARRAAKRARLGDKAGSKKPKGAAGGGGGLDDKFFRLSDMEKYVEQAERRAMRGGDDDEDDDMGEGDEDEESEGMEGLLAAGDEDEEDMSDEERQMAALLRNTAAAAKGKKGKKKGGAADDEEEDDEDSDDGGRGGKRQLRYQDFFGGGGQEGEEEEEDEEEEDDEEGGGGRGGAGDEDDEMGLAGRAGRGGLLSSDGGEDEDMEEGGDGGAARRSSGRDAGPSGKRSKEDAAALSSHERRLQRMQERVAEMESAALGEKSWQLIGEVAGGKRPLNSALEVDLEFESTAKPVPAQTEEMTNDLEVLIRKRIAERRFDDVVRVVPPPLEGRKKEVELDDTKAKSGLGELYEQDYVRQTAGGTADDKHERLRLEARSLFKALCGKLDALSRFHFAPKPVIEDMTVRSEVPAIVMEEAAPVAVSKAAMAAPEEVHRAAAKDGRPQAEGELTKEERRQRRARKKRSHKAKEAGQAADRAAKAAAAGGTAEVLGRKSDAKVVAGKGVRVAEGAGSSRHGRATIGNSTAVFAKLAAEQKAAAAGEGKAPKEARELQKVKGAEGGGAGKGSAAFKL